MQTLGSKHHIEFSHRRGFPIMRILWCPTSPTIGLQYTTIYWIVNLVFNDTDIDKMVLILIIMILH